MISPTRTNVTIVVVGDNGVGKTSLITTLVSGIFPETVPSVLQQVRIAPEDTADELGVLIVDTSSEESERPSVLERVRIADVVVCVYDVTVPETFEKLTKSWLDPISAIFQGPIVIVGNKIDLSDPSSAQMIEKEENFALRQKIRPLLDKYRVDACLDCSAKTNIHVTDLFFFAQHSVIYPVHPLLDTRDNSLRPKFKKALNRIFRFYDEDHDDRLNDSELNSFQEQCFGARLPDDDLDGIKTVLQKESSTFVEPNGVTFDGFSFLFSLFIKRNRPETAWSVLRRFNYDDMLNHKSNYSILLKNVSRDQSIELTKRGLAFFASVFHQFDKDNDGSLSKMELKEVFSEKGEHCWISKENNEDISTMNRSFCNLTDFPNGCLTAQSSSEMNVTLSGWLSQWAMTTNFSPATTCEQLELLGFHDFNLATALKITRRRQLEDRDNRLQRTVIRAFCFGDKGVGKSSLLNALVKKMSGMENEQEEIRSVAGMVRPLDSSHSQNYSSGSWFLILTELPIEEQENFFLSPAKVDCDLAVFIFDYSNPKSVEFLKGIQGKVPPTIPCVYIANARNVDDDEQDEEGKLKEKEQEEDNTAFLAAAELCTAYSLSKPDVVSLKPPSTSNLAETPKWNQGMDKLFGLLMTTALFPGAARPISDAQREINRQERVARSIKRISLVLGMITGIGYLTYFMISRRRLSTYQRGREED